MIIAYTDQINCKLAPSKENYLIPVLDPVNHHKHLYLYGLNNPSVASSISCVSLMFNKSIQCQYPNVPKYPFSVSIFIVL